MVVPVGAEESDYVVILDPIEALVVNVCKVTGILATTVVVTFIGWCCGVVVRVVRAASRI